jgi:hypothetical protein
MLEYSAIVMIILGEYYEPLPYRYITTHSNVRRRVGCQRDSIILFLLLL